MDNGSIDSSLMVSLEDLEAILPFVTLIILKPSSISFAGRLSLPKPWHNLEICRWNLTPYQNGT